MKIDIVTLFPNFFDSPLSESILKRAQDEGHVDIGVTFLRDYAYDVHKTIDGRPFGGGAGMVFKPEPIFECVEDLSNEDSCIVVMSPVGKPFNQQKAIDLSKKKHLILLSGHYEGFDQRIHEHLADEEISIGDFVTMGGEAPILCLIEAVVRLLPNVLRNADSIENESFSEELLEYPQYTKPRNFRGWEVPEILCSGHHEQVRNWRYEKALELTQIRRPDLLKKHQEIRNNKEIKK
jgi:tRNA (guanine37-N1)-methyltransferase